ncbi:hypothetical protein HG536_0E02610 [Torulaspora globosa]|uniref:Sorting assembly machinery 35 kDa subunit n=1 Tax=Torulaspora globosa TaxID=48254 RepID=A0A7G3ZIL4_9SACH|nr:uncharacterized protein HG536_0E02610 [Torulaspora globosa]QLL33350.1 hypothetical protein HG536_0E02610 [Torulaspora globosa]
MPSFFSVPGPIKTIFDSFPLAIYPAISKQDDSMSGEISRRKFAFQGSNARQDTPNNTFMLGVYNVFAELESGCLLATDPLCLYAQFALCKKNALGLPNGSTCEGRGYPHSIALLSHAASAKESLPILVEGFSKRSIRSAEGIDEILRTRVSHDAEQLMYITMLDHVVYDCWIIQVLYHTTEEEFLRLYSHDPKSTTALLGHLAIGNMKLALVKRNEFHLRHKELVKNIESPLNVYKARSLNHLLKPIFDKCKKTLLQFQDIMSDPSLRSTKDVSPTYLELKIASYILCILNLDEMAPLRAFVENQCQGLTKQAKLTVQKLQKAALN